MFLNAKYSFMIIGTYYVGAKRKGKYLYHFSYSQPLSKAVPTTPTPNKPRKQSIVYLTSFINDKF